MSSIIKENDEELSSFLEISFLPLKLTATAVKMCRSFTRVGPELAED